MVKNPPANVGDVGLIPGLGGSTRKGNATHSRIFAWKISRTEEPGRLQSTGSQRVGHDWASEQFYSMVRKRQGMFRLCFGVSDWGPWKHTNQVVFLDAQLPFSDLALQPSHLSESYQVTFQSFPFSLNKSISIFAVCNAKPQSDTFCFSYFIMSWKWQGLYSERDVGLILPFTHWQTWVNISEPWPSHLKQQKNNIKLRELLKEFNTILCGILLAFFD